MVTGNRITDELDDIDKSLLNVLQSDFPLVSRPFAAIGAKLGVAEAEAIERTRRLKKNGIIRQISAIFDSRALGYQSTLAAMQIAPERLDEVAAMVSAEAGVSHNYARNHAYNLWFTLTLPPGTDSQEALAALADRVGVEKWLYLPATRVFKIGVRFNMEEGDEPVAGVGGQGPGVGSDAVARGLVPRPDVVRELQEDIDITDRPFSAAAARLGLSEEGLLEEAAGLVETGVMRRFAAVLRHRRAGLPANGMGAWVVPEGRIEEVGPIMASFAQVTHCYQRPTFPDWPFNMFTMIHARTTDECEAIARDISDKTGIGEYRLLYSTKEYKKVRVKYFE